MKRFGPPHTGAKQTLPNASMPQHSAYFMLICTSASEGRAAINRLTSGSSLLAGEKQRDLSLASCILSWCSLNRCLHWCQLPATLTLSLYRTGRQLREGCVAADRSAPRPRQLRSLLASGRIRHLCGRQRPQAPWRAAPQCRRSQSISWCAGVRRTATLPVWGIDPPGCRHPARQRRCSSATSPWARPASSRASCMTSLTTPIRCAGGLGNAQLRAAPFLG